jgi:hypothetical protein
MKEVSSMGRMHRSVTLSVTIDAPYDAAFDYLSDGSNAAAWGVNFVKEVKETPSGLAMVTPFGEFPFRVRADRETGVVDHVVGEALYPARLVGNADGVDYMFTLQQPPEMPDDAFDAYGIPGMREELDTLKRILESRSRAKSD